MIMTTQLRLFRLKYKIALPELAEKANISRQQLNRLELCIASSTPYQEEKISEAVKELIAERKSELLEMERCYFTVKGKFLERMEVPQDGP